MQIDLEALLETIQFKNNANLRPVKAHIPYDIDMATEVAKCKADPIYFIETYIKVVHPDRGMVPMVLYEYQKNMVRAYHENRKVVTMASRQLGKTTVAAAYICWYLLYNKEKTVAIMANKQATAYEIMDRLRLMYENLPKFIQQGVKRWNRGSFELENLSKVFASATSKTAIRGRSPQLVYIDEYAFVENNQAEEFFTAVYPALSAGKESKMIISSTPNGFNHFYKIWNDSEKGRNGFANLLCMWNEHPDRDDKWLQEQISVLGELKANQEVFCTFLGSSLQLLSTQAMGRLSHDVPLKEYDGEYKGLRVYAYPKKDRVYTMTVDVSRGRHLDSSAFAVFDITEYPHTIAATYNFNDIAPIMYANVLHKIAKNYNEAFVLVEINDIGAQVAEEMYYSLEYENLYWTKSGDQLGKKGADPYPGIRTTKKTKRIGCANLKDIVERQQVIINDYTMINELSTFVQTDGGTYGADSGFHDDAVMCLVLYAWLCTQPWFIDLTDKNMKGQMYSAVIPTIEHDLDFMFVTDGTESYQNDNYTFDKEAMSLLLH